MQDKGFIIILGSPNSDKGELYNIAIERCELAIKEFKENTNYKFLLTGGYGEHFNKSTRPHAFYLKNYLKSKGIPESKIVEFAESSDTLEDASLTKPIVLKYEVKNIIIITSDYHYNRAKYIFEKEYFGTNVSLNFSIAETDEEKCEINLNDIKKHEKQALEKLKLLN